MRPLIIKTKAAYQNALKQPCEQDNHRKPILVCSLLSRKKTLMSALRGKADIRISRDGILQALLLRLSILSHQAVLCLYFLQKC